MCMTCWHFPTSFCHDYKVRLQAQLGLQLSVVLWSCCHEAVDGQTAAILQQEVGEVQASRIVASMALLSLKLPG